MKNILRRKLIYKNIGLYIIQSHNKEISMTILFFNNRYSKALKLCILKIGIQKP